MEAAKRYSLLNLDVAELDKHIEPKSVDWIITDPPYPEKFLWTFSALSKLASIVLKPNGGVLVMSGQHFLPEVIARLNEYLVYHWTCSYLTPGGQAAYNFPRKVNPFWKPIFVYRTKENTDWPCSFGDVIKTSPNNNDKNFHHWGQNVEGFNNLINRFTQPNQLILDPFVGGGTTGVAAIRTNRRFIGSDCDEDCIRDSEFRINQAIQEQKDFSCLFGMNLA